MWYDKQQLLSYNKIFNFVLSNRGGGKTFHFTRWAIDDFIKNKAMCVWVRRYQTEIDEMLLNGKFFDAVREYYPDHELSIDGNIGLIDKEPFIYFVALSTSRQLKSNNYPTVNKIIYDEFIIDKGRITYIKNEPEVFLDLFETVARMRDNVRAIFLANAVTVVNPYFTFFKVHPDEKKRFNVYPRGICIEFFTDAEFIKAKRKTKFGKLIEGTRYSDFSIDNKWLNDTDTFIESKPKQGSTFLLGLKYNGEMFGFWVNYERGYIYVNRQYDPSWLNLYTLTKEDHEPNLLLIKNLKDSRGLQMIIYAYQNALLRFEDMEIKSIMYEVIGLFLR